MTLEWPLVGKMMAHNILQRTICISIDSSGAFAVAGLLYNFKLVIIHTVDRARSPRMSYSLHLHLYYRVTFTFIIGPPSPLE
jgi:hypothetical protein